MAERNPNHEPAGTEKGGQVASGNAAVNSMIRKGANPALKSNFFYDWSSPTNVGDTYLVEVR